MTEFFSIVLSNHYPETTKLDSCLKLNMAEGGANPSLGGYDDEFVNAVDEELQCIICYLPLKDPFLTRCGHRFCKICLDEHFERFVLIPLL